MWAMGMAFGFLLLDITPGYNVALISYLFGSILSVPKSDIMTMNIIGVLILGLIVYFSFPENLKEWKSGSMEYVKTV